MRPNRARDAGFTLVEMLVGLALLAVAATLMVEGFSASRGAGVRLQTREQTADAVVSAQTRLRDRLEKMAPQARFEQAAPYVDVDGAPDSLDFRAGPGSGDPPGRVEDRRLRLTEDGDLVLDGPPAAGSAAAGADGPPAGEVLLHHVSSLELSYFGPQPDGTAAWSPDWSRRPAPPELVRVRVGFADHDRRVWPELIVRPAAQVDSACVLDPDAATCRGRA